MQSTDFCSGMNWRPVSTPKRMGPKLVRRQMAKGLMVRALVVAEEKFTPGPTIAVLDLP